MMEETSGYIKRVDECCCGRRIENIADAICNYCKLIKFNDPRYVYALTTSNSSCCEKQEPLLSISQVNFMLDVKFKKLHPNAVLPSYAKEGDAGLDLTCVSAEMNAKGQFVYGLGLAMEIPDGHVGLIFPRSSICKKDLNLCNAVGMIDSKYRGEVKAVFNRTSSNPEIYNIGDRIGQLLIIPYPKIKPVWADELSETDRGAGGFGSTGV